MTQIFKDYSDFQNREDKSINGVSVQFSEQYENWEEMNKTNEGCYDCSRCSRCSRCYDCSYCSECSDCSGCSYCSECYDCSGCSGCSRCYDCSYCSECSDCAGLKSDLPSFDVPVIQNIHSSILSAVDNPNALDMSKWHTCDTTHCRAGWVVFLAGEKGKELEEKTSTIFAAMQIYQKSSPEIKVSPTRFYEKNEIAMADIKRCAEEEKKLTTL